MARDVEQVGNWIMDGDKALQMPLRFEALHDPLSPPDWWVGILRPIVQALVEAMLDTEHDLLLCSAVGSKLVRDHHPRRPAVALQELAQQALGRFGIAAALHENVQDEAVLIHGAPQPVLLAPDLDDYLIEVALVAKLAC